MKNFRIQSLNTQPRNHHNQRVFILFFCLMPYFRNLYNIIKFIDNSNIEDKQLYTVLVQRELDKRF